jgi:hypothetical protein
MLQLKDASIVLSGPEISKRKNSYVVIGKSIFSNKK